MCTKPRARFQNSDPPNQRNRSRLASRSNYPSQRDFLLPNITYTLIIHSGSVARTVPIKNHGQDSSTSQLESIRFKYLGLKHSCPEYKNRYANHTCINKGLSHGAIFLATCNAILLLVDVKLANTGLHRVTGPLAHDVVLNHTFELLISITKWNYKQM